VLQAWQQEACAHRTRAARLQQLALQRGRGLLGACFCSWRSRLQAKCARYQRIQNLLVRRFIKELSGAVAAWLDGVWIQKVLLASPRLA
jgi:hypothetical protein